MRISLIVHICGLIVRRELFFAEAPGHEDEKVTPPIRRTAAVLWKLYSAFTVIQVFALWAVGLTLFDAVNRSLTRLSLTDDLGS